MPLIQPFRSSTGAGDLCRLRARAVASNLMIDRVPMLRDAEPTACGDRAKQRARRKAA